MANDCSNTLIVRGSSNNLIKMKNLLFDKNNEFTFQITSPIPTEIDKSLLPVQESMRCFMYSLPDWYLWCIVNWGTKWDAYYEFHQITNKEIIISFCSAWAPPIAWLRSVCKKYPKLYYELSYYDTGGMVGGLSIGENGELKDEFWDLETDPVDGSIWSGKTCIMQGDSELDTNDEI